MSGKLRSIYGNRLGFWIIRHFGLLGSWCPAKGPRLLYMVDPRGLFAPGEWMA